MVKLKFGGIRRSILQKLLVPTDRIINNEEKEWTFVDFAVPWNTNIETTEAEKVSKYAPLANNIQKLHKVRTLENTCCCREPRDYPKETCRFLKGSRYPGGDRQPANIRLNWYC